ncbi:uncharacterized protein LOC125107889 isoform X2 [Lutra lutra]|uniref:uncharacterized protein LOC125107889 isoform X2 n=1 Tax=Lutra lutra TaxID=9657 RepID=UPI001FD13919|nr:uncharacterized protein LOC125107889 isoform X2 [Lutra lutra]
MATYPPRRLLGARPLPSDPRRDPRRSGFTEGGGGRWEQRLPTGQGWGWADRFPRVQQGVGRGASLPHLFSAASSLFPTDSLGGAQPLRSRCNDQGLYGRYSPPGAGLLCTEHWPSVGGGPRGPGAGNGEVASARPLWGRGTCLCLCSCRTPRPSHVRLEGPPHPPHPRLPPPEAKLIAVPFSSLSPRDLRCLCTHFQGLAACHHHLLRSLNSKIISDRPSLATVFKVAPFTIYSVF